MTSKSMVDLISQALKCLSERCPFDGEEQLSRVPTLPFSVAARLSKHSDAKRKFKKSASSHGGGGDGGALLPAAAAAHSSKHSGKSGGIWEAIEPYFRPIKESDIAFLKPKLPPGSCFEIPVPEGSEVAEVGPSFVQVDERSGEKAEAMEIDIVENFTSVSGSEVPVREEEREKEKEKEEEEKEEEEKEKEEEEETLSWVLGSKHRMVLTTQRPTKKRKLLGTDAGLDQLLLLPKKEESSSSAICDVCCLGESEGKSKELISCSSCSALVHKKCYGVVGDVEEETWLCSWCKYLEGMEEEKRNEEKGLRGCVLCSKGVGALKMVGGGSGSEGEKKKFAHLFCSVWTPEVHVEDIRVMEPVLNVGGVPEMRTKLVCNVCKVKHGVCVRCSHGTCRTAFHPICAREARHHMEIWGKFGCDNVELRAFCSKHPQDIGSAQQMRNLTEITADDSSNAKPLSATLLPNKLPKLRLSRKNKEKNMAQSEIVSTVSSEVDKNEKTLEIDALAPKLSPKGGDMQLSKDLNTGVIGSDNNLPDISNLVQVMKKLIDRGKIFVGDVASDLGISSDFLEAALMGEISSCPSVLGLKIAKWFQGSIYLPASMRQLKFRNGTAISSGSLAARVDCPNAVDVQGLDIPPSAKGLDPDNGDACSVELLPPCGIIDNKCNLKEEKTTCSSGEKIAQSTKGELVDVVSDDQIIYTVVTKDDLTGPVSPVHDQSHSCNDQVILETISKETAPDSSPSLVLAPQLEGNSTMVGKDEMSDTQQQPECTAKNLISTELGNGQTDEALTNPCSVDAVKKGRNSGSCSSSYVHPYIQRRLMQVEEDVLTMRESGQSNTNGQSENTMLSAKASDSSNHYLPSGCTNMDFVVDPKEVDQLTKAKNMGILELSPEDELEGEIIYLQNKLLDNTVSTKHGFEDLMGRVVQKLPQEVEALKKQQWDSVLINQYLREVREAKKWGRKERKHREAQAVLAAAAAAAATSSRNTLLRKDETDGTSFPHQESSPKVNGTLGRAAGHSPLGSRLKDTQRQAIVRVSQDKPSGIFHSECSNENALFCDICRRSETLLNRIFVCSSCKVPVHLDCYRKLKDPIGPWKCELCEEMSQLGSPRNQFDNTGSVTQCCLCGGGTGAFRKTTNGQWVHAFCAEWLLELGRGQQNHIDGMDAISKEKDLYNCCICHQNIGVCSKCSFGHCQVTFHPYCARIAGFYMNVKTIGGRSHHKAYCEKHSVEQRQKADNQQHGAEELKNIKQIRFELERVRLLCERINKREKVKRDLVLCSHEILAARRDCVAYKMLVRSSYPPGVSSESATTSIDNKSTFSGTLQRSEEATVDSKVSGKRNVKLSLDMDRKTDDSSTSQLSFKHKIPDRISSSGKQLPHRTTSVPSRSSADDAETNIKARKHTETFHKEVVMTSHQASVQNQRLPKGFAYVPIDYVSSGKPVLHDSDSHETEEPGG